MYMWIFVALLVANTLIGMVGGYHLARIDSRRREWMRGMGTASKPEDKALTAELNRLMED